MKFDINNIEKIIENSNYKEEIKELISKYDEITIETLTNMIKSMKLYCDYDEVLCDLITPWIKDINSRNNTKYKNSDVNDFFWFEGIENGLEFLNDSKMYDRVNPTKESKLFLKTLEKNKLINNLSIVTSTMTNAVVSKEKHINTHFSKFIDLKRVHTTSSKWEMNYDNAILIDDGFHNAVKTVIANPYAYVFLLNYDHNKDFYTGKRIIRINSLMEVFDYLPLIAMRSYDRHFSPEFEHLRKEMYINKSQSIEKLEKKYSIKKKENNHISLNNDI